MTTQGHTAAMRHCIAQSCEGGRVCRTPLQCSGAGPLVDESIELWRRDRLQQVDSVEARWTEPRPTVYLAPGVVEGPDMDSPVFTPEDAGLLTSRAFWVICITMVAAWLVVGWWVKR